MEKKILLAVDGSISSIQSLEYVAALFADRPDVKITILHCTSSGCTAMPEAEDPDNSLMPTGHVFDRQHAAAQRHLRKAEERLTGLGVAADRVTTVTIPSSANVATALRTYAERHYFDSIVVGRRGIGLVGEMILGSVSAELFRKSRKIPLWIVDGKIDSRRILVPVDGSVPSLMAVDHLAHIFAGRDDIAFHFFHSRGLLSSKIQCVPEDFYGKWGKEWCDTHLSGQNCLFNGPIQVLLDAGVAKEMIYTLPEPTAFEESMSIVSHAKKQQCGTIVIGRRREGMAKGLLGSVTSRTIMQTQDMALWVVG